MDLEFTKKINFEQTAQRSTDYHYIFVHFMLFRELTTRTVHTIPHFRLLFLSPTFDISPFQFQSLQMHRWFLQIKNIPFKRASNVQYR